jgi:hypothetical protein
MDADLENRGAQGTQGQPETKSVTTAPAKAPSAKPRVRNRKKDSAAEEEANKRRCVSTACIGTCPLIGTPVCVSLNPRHMLTQFQPVEGGNQSLCSHATASLRIELGRKYG